MKVILRELLEKDLKQTFLWHNDKNLSQQILSYPPPISWEDEVKWFHCCKNLEADKKRFTKIICIFDSSKYSSVVQDLSPEGLFIIEDHFQNQIDSCEIGMFLYRHDLRGQGYGSQALAIGVEECKRIFPDQKIHLTVQKENIAAIHFYERNGFVKISESSIEKNGSKHSVIFMAYNSAQRL